MRVQSLRFLLVATLLASLALLGTGCGSVNDSGPDLTPPVGPTGLSATAAGRDIVITWTQSLDPDVAGVIIVAYRGLAPAGGPLPGAYYAVGDAVGNGVVIAAHTGHTAIDVAPPVCPLTYYQAWAWDEAGNWSDAPESASVAGGTIVAPPTLPPTGLAATVAGGRIALSWTNPPAASGFTVVRLVHASGAPPSGPQDGNLVYTGPGQATTDSLVPYLPGDTQYYAAYACNACGQCESVGVTAQVTPTIAQALTGGGYTIFWRHASATVCGDSLGLGSAATTTVPGWWRSCDANCPTATARQLNAQGPVESLRIGSDLRTLGVPFGRVISSEFCRCFTTADLMDLGPVVEQRSDVTFFVYDEPNRCANTFILLGQVPAAGTNTAIIGQSGNTCELASLQWAEAAIYKPTGGGGTTFITRVLWDGWLGLP